MAICIIDWKDALSHALTDEIIGLTTVKLSESNSKGTYLSIVPPGFSGKPHYHRHGNGECHVLNGNGVIKLFPVNRVNKDFQLVCKYVREKNSFIIPPNIIHQIINNSDGPLMLLFSCPLSHLKEDRITVDDLEEIIDEKKYSKN